MAQAYAQMAGTVKASQVLTPQSQPIPGREVEQHLNPAGGYSFKADDWARLSRFLILGVMGNSIYQSQGDMVKSNAGHVEKLLAQDGIRVVNEVVDVLSNSRSLKVDAPLFVLALALNSKDVATRVAASAAIKEVVRIPTHLFILVGYVNSMRGWGRSLRRGIAQYYLDTAMPKLAMHAWKYKSREGWTHRDVLRLAHAKTSDPARNAVLKYMTHGTVPDAGEDRALAQIAAAEELLHTTDAKRAINLIRDHRLTREAVPTELLNNKAVWEALLEDMPVTAMVRNLGKMTNIGLLDRLSKAEQKVLSVLGNQDQITKSRIHPMAVYLALKTYAQGKGNKGSLTWNTNGAITDALDTAFYMAFGNVEKTGKRILLAIDDSGSMRGGWSSSVMDGLLTPHEAAAAMALVTYMIEPSSVLIGYSGKYSAIDLSRKARVNDLSRKIASHGSGTDTSLPVQYALDKSMDFDAIVSYTDNNTWSGSGHVTQYLRKYETRVGHPVRFLNVAMESGRSTDVDPTNPNMLELVGMDSNTPQIISEFIAGRV